MLKVEAILSNDGKLEFQEHIEWKNSVRVLVTFIEPEMPIRTFNNERNRFLKVRNIMKKYNLNLSETVIEERRIKCLS